MVGVDFATVSFEFGSGFRRIEEPVNLNLVLVAFLAPGQYFSSQGINIFDSSIQALLGKGSKLYFSHVKPRSMNLCVVKEEFVF